MAGFRLRRFLSAEEREQIAAALDEAGSHTRARIGLSIDERASGDPQLRAHTLCQQWDLSEDERSTAVLVYVCAANRTFAIIGGDLVCQVFPQAFWELVDRDLRHHFDEGRYCDGIFKAIAQVAVQLERHFPRDHPHAPGQGSKALEFPRGSPRNPGPEEIGGERKPKQDEAKGGMT